MASLLRRIAPTILVTGAAVAVVSLFDPALAGVGTGTPDAAGLSPAPRPSTRAKPTPTTDPSASSSSGSSPSPSTAAPSTNAGGCDTAQEVDGPAIRTRFGPVQVAANVTASGKVCDVYAIAYPTSDRRSAQISDYAIPRLDASATTSELDFQWVSGATYTSDGYYSSLQALLDSL